VESEAFRHLLEQYGAAGMGLAMFLESSVIPFPSEAVVAAAGYFGIPLGTIVWAGAAGSTLGGCVGYAIGRSGVRWLLDRYGRWFGVTQARLSKMDALAVRYGVWSVLIGRLLPRLHSEIGQPVPLPDELLHLSRLLLDPLRRRPGGLHLRQLLLHAGRAGADRRLLGQLLPRHGELLLEADHTLPLELHLADRLGIEENHRHHERHLNPDPA